MTISPAELLGQVLRLSSEPCIFIDDMDVHRRLTANPAAYLDWLRRELEAIAHGRATIDLPPKQIFADPLRDSDFRIMPCVVRHGNVVRKTIKVIGTNTRQVVIPDQITVGKALVVDHEENFVSHLIDACLLSSARTGACAALAASLLTPTRTTVAVIGAGRVGYYSALYTAHAGNVSRVFVADAEPGRAQATTRLLASELPGIELTALPCEELPPVDVAILATTSRAALCQPPAWGARLVISLGADTDHQRELSPEWASRAEIYVDTRDSARFGDLASWIRSGHVTSEGLVDLLEVIRAHPLPAPTRTRVFISTGSALFDNLTIGYLLDHC